MRQFSNQIEVIAVIFVLLTLDDINRGSLLSMNRIRHDDSDQWSMQISEISSSIMQ